jgi:hypothetical protein
MPLASGAKMVIRVFEELSAVIVPGLHAMVVVRPERVSGEEIDPGFGCRRRSRP